MGLLLKEFDSRIVYDAASNRNAKMANFIVYNEWRKPRHLSIDLIQVLHTWPNYTPNENIRDAV